MANQLPTPSIELLILQIFLGSLTFLGLALGLAWKMKRNNKFRWKAYISILLNAFVFGNMGALLIWANWPFALDIMLGPILLPGLVSYATVILIGLRFSK